MIPNHQEYLIDGILPCREVNLIGGSSGSSKTTFVLQFLQNWQRGESVFGCASHPVPMIYVACERSLFSTQRTLDRCQAMLNCPVLSVTRHREWRRDMERGAFDPMARYIASEYPDVRFLLLDGFQSLIPGGKGNDYAAVSKFMLDVTATCEENNWTILGSAHATKVKEGEKYVNPRERLLGSVAWAGYSETVIIIESSDPEDPDSMRDIQICPRNAAQMRFSANLDQRGLLTWTPVEKPPRTSMTRAEKCQQAIEAALAHYGPDDLFDLEAIYTQADVSRSYMYKVKDSLIEQGLFVPADNGMFRKPYPS